MFPGPDSMGFVWGGVGRALMTYDVCALSSYFCYVGGFGDLNDPLVPTLRGVSGDVVIVYAYYDTKGPFFAVCSLAEGRSTPVPKTRNGCFHQ